MKSNIIFTGSPHAQNTGRYFLSIMKAKSQPSQIEELQAKLDDISVLNWDLEERCHILSDRKAELEFQCVGHHATISRLEKYRHEDAIQYAKTKKDLEASESNRKYAMEQLKIQNQTIELAKAEIEKLRSSKISADHLARKAIEQVSKNETIQKELNELNASMQSQIEAVREDYENRDVQSLEIQKYKTQTTRLIQEKVQQQQLIDHTDALLKQAITDLNNLKELFAASKKEFDDKLRILINALALISHLSWKEIICNSSKIIAKNALNTYDKLTQPQPPIIKK